MPETNKQTNKNGRKHETMPKCEHFAHRVGGCGFPGEERGLNCTRLFLKGGGRGGRRRKEGGEAPVTMLVYHTIAQVKWESCGTSSSFLGVEVLGGSSLRWSLSRSQQASDGRVAAEREGGRENHTHLLFTVVVPCLLSSENLSLNAHEMGSSGCVGITGTVITRFLIHWRSRR